MKRILCLLLLGALSVNPAFTQNEKRWGRPVSTDFSIKVGIDSLQFFTGEFLETQAEKKGSLKWDGSVFEINSNGGKVEKSLKYAERREMTPDDLSWLKIDTAYFHSQRLIDPTSVDSLFIKLTFNEDLGKLRIINQSQNKILESVSLDPGVLSGYPVSSFGLDSLAQGKTTVLRFSVKDRLSSTFPLRNAPATLAQPVEETEPGFFERLWTWIRKNWEWLVMGLLALLCIFEFIYFYLLKDRKDSDEEDEEGTSLVTAPLTRVEPENDEIARRDEEIRRLKQKLQLIAKQQADLEAQQEKEKDHNGENPHKKINELSDQLKEQKKAIAKLESAQAESKKQMEGKDEIIRKKEERIAELKKESEEALAKEKTKAKENEEKLKEEHKKQIAAKDKTLAEKNEEIQKVKEDCNLRVEKEKKLAKDREEVLQKEKESVSSQLDTTKATLADTQNKLTSTEEDLSHRKEDIVRLKKEQEIYTTRVVFVNYAKDYALSIKKLLTLGEEIHNSASELLGQELSDPYYLYKAMAKYAKAVDAIDMTQFHTDVSMIAKHGLVFSDTSLATLQQDGNANLNESMRQYFFSRYLEKYIDSLVVFNESIIGLPRLIEGLPQSKALAFKQYREQILTVADELGLTVKTVHLFEPAGNNVDLNVRLVNAGEFPSDAILEIGNCYVYPTGADRPKHKINVIVQE